jgi:hypothetical protein
MEGSDKIPSVNMPIKIVSVPVFGYFSFLASSSAILNDLIALADHLSILARNTTFE